MAPSTTNGGRTKRGQPTFTTNVAEPGAKRQKKTNQSLPSLSSTSLVSQQQQQQIIFPTALQIGKGRIMRTNHLKPPPPQVAATATVSASTKRTHSSTTKNKKKKTSSSTATKTTGVTTQSSDIPAPSVVGPTEMTPLQAKLWNSSYAAKCAAACHNPGGIVRLVGTITRHVYVPPNVTDPFRNITTTTTTTSQQWKNHHDSRDNLVVPPLRNIPSSFKPPPPAQTKQQIMNEWRSVVTGANTTTTTTQPPTETELVQATQQRIQEWKQILGAPYTPSWNRWGELVDCPYDGSIQITKVLKLLQTNVLIDCQPDMEKSFYHGLRKVNVDTQTILESLKRFCDLGKGSYEQPMMVAFAVPQLLKTDEGNDNNKNGQKLYQLTIPVYAHRLVFEVMWLHDAHTVFSALDDDSYHTVRPLVVPPQVDTPVFYSAPTPRVVIDDLEDDNDEVVVEQENENGEMETDGNVDDLLHSSNQRQQADEISAYTFTGLLKLLESPGCDISAWPQIQAKLDGQLQVDLLPHQKHGVCWMIQQENIPGGLNSIMWEERKFVDGHGTYFFSPAVGQVRLRLGGGKETNLLDTTGGILADEMGLGKTVQILALVCATKDEDKVKRATLVVVPAALLTQWKQETAKITGKSLRTNIFDPVTLTFQPAVEGESTEGNIDLVLTTYACLSSQSAFRILRSIPWKRIVLDEMQNIRSSTTMLAKNCQGLSGNRRWMLSGTPLFESIEDFRGELSFLGLEPFAANNDDGFFNFCIAQHWKAESHFGIRALEALSLVMLRRSKRMTYLDPIEKVHVPLLGLPPLTVTNVPVPQDTSERAIYCFLEYLVHSNLRDDKKNDVEDNTSHRRKHHESNRTRYLKLLFDSCMSMHLLTGGPGCPCLLNQIDRAMIQKNRKGATLVSGNTNASLWNCEKPLSVDEAIEFLARVIDGARVNDDFISDFQQGGGMGRSRRDRAADSVAVKLEEATSRLKSAQRMLATAKSERARARWHYALEMITTGQVQKPLILNRSIQSLWNWRRVLLRLNEVGRITMRHIPPALCRGWRPSSNYFFPKSFYRARRNWRRLLRRITRGELFRVAEKHRKQLNYVENSRKFNGSDISLNDDVSVKKCETDCVVFTSRTRRCHALWRWRFFFRVMALRKRETSFPDFVLEENYDVRLYRLSRCFRWARPRTVLVTEIPRAVSKAQLHNSILEGLSSSTCQGSVVIDEIAKDDTFWRAYVHFLETDDFSHFIKNTKKMEGIAVATDAHLSWIDEALEKAKEELKNAAAANTVYPCEDNINKYGEAKRAYRLASLGLRMLYSSDPREGHIKITIGFQQLRRDTNLLSPSLLDKCMATIDGCSNEVYYHNSVVEVETRMIDRLTKAVDSNISSKVQNLSTFEILEALKDGKNDLTGCPVCLNPLGNDDESHGLVALTKCGHLFCVSCLQQYFQSQGQGRNPPCISCRKPIASTEAVVVDPKRKDDGEIQKKRSAARSLVRSACKQLEESRGHLEPAMWQALYMSFDVPSGISKARHSTFTNIPGDLLAHLREVTGLALSRGSNCSDDIWPSKLSSKVRRLITDLPRNERSVVFASSIHVVKHLKATLPKFEFTVYALFTGQPDSKVSEALDSWRSSHAGVLAIQTGAAAAGLTLTDASKMFLMAPLLSYEEEQQAYGRLHRHGQTKEVECRVYFTPVSIESRLHEWRKLRSCIPSEDENHVFAKIETDSTELNEEEDATSQAQYLLGLGKVNSGTAEG